MPLKTLNKTLEKISVFLTKTQLTKRNRPVFQSKLNTELEKHIKSLFDGEFLTINFKVFEDYIQKIDQILEQKFDKSEMWTMRFKLNIVKYKLKEEKFPCIKEVL